MRGSRGAQQGIKKRARGGIRVRPAFAVALLASAISLSGLFAGAADAITYVEATPPETVLTSGPATLTTETSAAFFFSSTKADVTRFQCSLDHTNFVPCLSPKVYGALSAGVHSFEVSAVDAVGNADPTPAVWQWTVVSSASVGPPPTNCRKGFKKAMRHGKTVCLKKKKHRRSKHR
jgi:hypothetical protein